MHICRNYVCSIVLLIGHRYILMASSEIVRESAKSHSLINQNFTGDDKKHPKSHQKTFQKREMKD